jgi:hypothetical protein
MGDVVMDECEKKQKISYIVQIDYKHFQGRYGRLQLSNIYTCHGFFQRTHEFKEVDSKTFFQKLLKRFVNKYLVNLGNLISIKFMKP